MEREPKIEYQVVPDAREPQEAEKPTELAAPENEIKSEKELRKASAEVAFQMMVEAKGEFPEEVQRLIEKRQNRQPLSSEEQPLFDSAQNKWWQEKFGVAFGLRFGTGSKKERWHNQKREEMQRLHTALRNLDAGNPVEKFQEKERRALYYDEKRGQYFVIANSIPRYLGIGDILSDYAWGIKYAPDSNVPRQAFRALAKRILINETRRDIEDIYNKELAMTKIKKSKGIRGTPTYHPSLFFIEKRWNQPSSREVDEGLIAETMCREWLTRISLNQEFSFIVMRANSVEDGIYKYDFKIRFIRRNRGVAVGDETDYQEVSERLRKIGIQFTIGKRHKGQSFLAKIKKTYRKNIPVDDIIFVRIQTHEFGEAFDKWLASGKPSGGPEQFLSRELKTRLLKETTEGLVKIGEVTVEKLFQ